MALWTRHWAATALVYFWGLTLTIQGIITPSLTDLFPHPQYFMFWGMHFFTVWAAVYLTFGLNVRPNWRSYRFAVATTAGWAVTVMTFNALTGTNYGYLNRKPAVGTLLDLFGPWPAYVVVEIALVAGSLGTDDLALDPRPRPRLSMPRSRNSTVHREPSHPIPPGPGSSRSLVGCFASAIATDHH